MQYVAIVESERNRSFHGPFTTAELAVKWVNVCYPNAVKAMVEKLGKPTPGWDIVHPDQTTLDDQINSVHDHVE